jgi:putative FmdB family regulatory protein
MPLYEHVCPSCGPVELWRSVELAGQPAACPQCAAPAPRRFAAPGGRSLSRGVRQGLEAEERSRHEPQRLNGRDLARGGHSHDHGHSHAHPSAGRPWQLSH